LAQAVAGAAAEAAMARAASLPPVVHSLPSPAPPPARTPPVPLGSALPQPPSDDALRATIAERFADAYEAQLGHLTRVHAEEQSLLQADISQLRQTAYAAQRGAAEHRARVEAARHALGTSVASTAAMHQALQQARAELAAVASALAASQAGQRREEQEAAELRQRVAGEAAELEGRIAEARGRRMAQEERALELERALDNARQERLAEVYAARRHEMHEREALAERDRILLGLRGHEELAVRSLKEAVAKLEADFAQERVDFREQERRAKAQIQEYERLLAERRWPPGSCLQPGIWHPS